MVVRDPTQHGTPEVLSGTMSCDTLGVAVSAWTRIVQPDSRSRRMRDHGRQAIAWLGTREGSHMALQYL